MSQAFEFETLLSAEARRATRGGSMVTPATAAGEIRANLVIGQPAVEALPLEAMVEAARQALPGNPKALLYGRREGAIELVDLVREKLRRYEGLEVEREQLIITNGSSQAIDLVLRAFTDPDAPLALDEASFGAMFVKDLTGNAGHIPFDVEGPQAETLDRLAAAEATRPAVFYTIPTFQNPMGVTTSTARRRELLEVCRSQRVPVLEDDAYYELRYEGERIPSLFELDGGSGLVMRTGTFSKILGAGIRLGWLMTAAPLAKRLVGLKPDGGTSPFSSALAAAFMREHMETQIPRLQALYRSKRDVMLDALDQHLRPFATWSRPEGGFFVWATLREPELVKPVVERCAQQGVLIAGGGRFRVDGEHRGTIRLAFSHATADQIRDGIAVLGRVAAELSEGVRQASA